MWRVEYLEELRQRVLDSDTYALFCSWIPIQVAFSKKLAMLKNRFLLGVFHADNIDFDYCPKQFSSTVTVSFSDIFICSENHRHETTQMSCPLYPLPSLGNIYLAYDQDNFLKLWPHCWCRTWSSPAMAMRLGYGEQLQHYYMYSKNKTGNFAHGILPLEYREG